jgi:hypothetical protein
LTPEGSRKWIWRLGPVDIYQLRPIAARDTALEL